eukprot:6093531-Prorocentrum_lima.AAC.1
MAQVVDVCKQKKKAKAHTWKGKHRHECIAKVAMLWSERRICIGELGGMSLMQQKLLRRQREGGNGR